MAFPGHLMAKFSRGVCTQISLGGGALWQCSPYQAVTSKIYHLKQQFLLPATS